MALNDGHFIWNGVSNISTNTGTFGNVTWNPIMTGDNTLFPLITTSTMTSNPAVGKPEMGMPFLGEKTTEVQPEVGWHQWAFAIDQAMLSITNEDSNEDMMSVAYDKLTSRALKEIEDNGWVRIPTIWDSCEYRDSDDERLIVLTLLVAKP